MAVLKRRTRPEPWRRQRAQAKYAWLVPVFALEWSWRWLAYLLSGWAFLEVLEYFGTLSLLVAAVSYFGESKDLNVQRKYLICKVNVLQFSAQTPRRMLSPYLGTSRYVPSGISGKPMS